MNYDCVGWLPKAGLGCADAVIWPDWGQEAIHSLDVKAHFEKHNHQIAMRDGVHFLTAVFIPRDRSKAYPNRYRGRRSATTSTSCGDKGDFRDPKLPKVYAFETGVEPLAYFWVSSCCAVQRTDSHHSSGAVRYPVGLHARHLREHLAVTIAVDELRGSVEVEQTFDGFTGQWPGKDVAFDDDAVHFSLTDLLEYRLQRGEVGMNVVDGSDTQDGIPLIGR